jgi:tetratricopeptide (TPR) repeat protein
VEDNQQLMIENAKSLFKNKNLKKCVVTLEELVTINPTHIEAYHLLANTYHLLGAIGKAIKAFQKVLEINPNHTDASISLSVLLNDIGRYEEAQKIFERANVHVKKENAGINDPHINTKFSLKHYELAEMYFTYNRFEESLFEYNKAYQLDPENLEIRIKMAKVYSKKGYASKAIDELRKLKREYPAYTPARTALGLLFYGAGKIIEAQTEWKNALVKDPQNEEIQMYLDLSNNATEVSL